MSHYFTNDNVKSEEKEINILFQNKSFKMITDNGVFSKKGLDYGTRALLEKIPFSELKGDILDFGCGYGPIGIIISSLTNLKVDMLFKSENDFIKEPFYIAGASLEIGDFYYLRRNFEQAYK